MQKGGKSMTYPPIYSELYVVSDIHLGGRRDAHDNFQIFNRGERLGNLARYKLNGP